jgi:imidazolonepropionase-like amidohydrolase
VMTVQKGLVLTGFSGPPGPVRIVGDRVAAVGPGTGANPGDEVVDLTGYLLRSRPAGRAGTAVR